MLSLAKILENMEIGHNVMHGQWDWMNDPQINSSTWDWDTASTAEAWKHSHNYVHHTYTNIRGKDRDLGYEIMRIDPHQKWHPVYLLQPFYNLRARGVLRVGRRLPRPRLRRDQDAARSPRQTSSASSRAWRARRAARSSRTTSPFPALSAARRASRDARCAGARKRRCDRRAARPRGAESRTTSRGRRSCDADGRLHRQHRAQRVGLRDHLLRPLPRPDVHVQPGGGRRRDARRLLRAPAARRGEHRGQRRSSTCISGNLGYQVEHHLYPDMPSTRYAEIAPRVQGHLRALRAALQHRAVLQAARHRAAHDPAARVPGRQAAARSPGPTAGTAPTAPASSAIARRASRGPARTARAPSSRPTACVSRCPRGNSLPPGCGEPSRSSSGQRSRSTTTR